MGQVIAQIPMFSGSAFRAGVLVLVIAVPIVYVMMYAARVKKNPQSICKRI